MLGNLFRFSHHGSHTVTNVTHAVGIGFGAWAA